MSYKFAPRNRSRQSRGRFNYRSRGSRRPAPSYDVSKFINIPSQEVEVQVQHVPQYKFEDFRVDEKVKSNIRYKKYVNPTPIQDQAIPAIIDGKDVIGLANTGTGKTAAFIIPLVSKVIRDRSQKVLIVAPTRELAMQIQEEFRTFAFGTNIDSVLIIGGSNMNRQIQSLKRKPNFVIGTPGRLKDLKNRNVLNLAEFNNIVLDEVDRMLDMGFIHDIKFIISHLPKFRQSLFFSATLPYQAESIAKELLHEPILISVKTGDTSKNIHQDVIRFNNPDEKFSLLADLLGKEEVSKAIVFSATKHGAQKLSDKLNNFAQTKSEVIHGNKSQSQRQRALNSFKKGEVNVLIATDVAARGLDISDISHVINYDLPQQYEDYIHRIGRTGRADKKGIALTFVPQN